MQISGSGGDDVLDLLDLRPSMSSLSEVMRHLAELFLVDVPLSPVVQPLLVKLFQFPLDPVHFVAKGQVL